MIESLNYFQSPHSWYFNLSWQSQKRSGNEVGEGTGERFKQMLPR